VRQARRARFGSAAAFVFACAVVPRAEGAQFGLPVEPDTGVFDISQEKPGQPPLFPGGGLLSALHTERQELKDMGITFSLHERSEVWADVSGGGHQGLSYNGLTIAKLNLDLDALFGWSGAEFFTSAFDIHGHGPTRSFVGNQQLISNIEATPSIKLYDLWLDQTLFDKKLSIRAGQEGANDEMMVTAYGGLFLNSSFGFPGMPASDLPSGGPNYPMATPFARALFAATDKLTIVGAVYTDDPAPPGVGDPQARDRNGTAFRLNDHTLGFGELWYSPDTDASDNLPWALGTRPVNSRTNGSTIAADCSPARRVLGCRSAIPAIGRFTASSTRKYGSARTRKNKASAFFCKSWAGRAIAISPICSSKAE